MKVLNNIVSGVVEWVFDHWPFFLGLVAAGVIILLVCIYN